MTSPVAGLMVGKDLPDAASTHLLLMRSLLALILIVGSRTAVAIGGLLANARAGQTKEEYSGAGKQARNGKRSEGRRRTASDGMGKLDKSMDTPLPRFCVSADSKGFKVICFDTHL